MVDTPYPVARDFRRTDVLVGNGGTVYSGFGFKIFDVDDVAVYLKRSGDTEFALVSATVTKAAALDYDDFSVTFASAITSADQYFVIGATAVERTAGVRKGTKIDPDALEREFSRIAVMLNEARRDLDRAVLVSPEFEAAPMIAGDVAEGQVFVQSGGKIIGVDLLSVADPVAGAAVLAALVLKADLTYVDTQLALKATAASVYTKTAADALLAAKADAASTQTIAERGELAGLRNRFANGSAHLIQRGGLIIAAGASGYVFDRWFVTNGTNQAVTVSQVQLGLGSGFAPGGRYVMRHTFAVAPTSGTLRIEQRIDDVTTVKPKAHTLTTWMTGPTGTETLAAQIVQNFGTGGSPSSPVTTAMTPAGGSPTTIYSASTNRRCWGVTVPSLSGKVLGSGNNDYLAVAMVLTPRQAGNYDVTWSSFVEGDAANETDAFGPLAIDRDIMRCMRFYFAGIGTQMANPLGTTTNISSAFQWPVPLRIAPSSYGWAGMTFAFVNRFAIVCYSNTAGGSWNSGGGAVFGDAEIY